MNNVVEADYGKLKQLIRPVRGFKTLKTAYATIKGFEVMRALRKGQAGAFNITRDICGEARVVERAFGLGACAISEAVRFVSERPSWKRPDGNAHSIAALRTSLARRLQQSRQRRADRPK